MSLSACDVPYTTLVSKRLIDRHLEQHYDRLWACKHAIDCGPPSKQHEIRLKEKKKNPAYKPDSTTQYMMDHHMGYHELKLQLVKQSERAEVDSQPPHRAVLYGNYRTSYRNKVTKTPGFKASAAHEVMWSNHEEIEGLRYLAAHDRVKGLKKGWVDHGPPEKAMQLRAFRRSFKTNAIIDKRPPRGIYLPEYIQRKGTHDKRTGLPLVPPPPITGDLNGRVSAPPDIAGGAASQDGVLIAGKRRFDTTSRGFKEVYHGVRPNTHSSDHGGMPGLPRHWRPPADDAPHQVPTVEGRVRIIAGAATHPGLMTTGPHPSNVHSLEPAPSAWWDRKRDDWEAQVTVPKKMHSRGQRPVDTTVETFSPTVAGPRAWGGSVSSWIGSASSPTRRNSSGTMLPLRRGTEPTKLAPLRTSTVADDSGPPEREVRFKDNAVNAHEISAAESQLDTSGDTKDEGNQGSEEPLVAPAGKGVTAGEAAGAEDAYFNAEDSFETFEDDGNA